MNEVGRGILYLGLAVLLAGLISVGLVDAVQADQMEGLDGGNDQMSPERRGGEELYRNPDIPMGLPVDLLFSGHGFAIRGNESHPLRLKVEVLLPVQPEQIRKLVASNKSLKEIRDDIRENVGDEVHRGSLIFDRRLYAAINVSSLPGSNNSTLLEADLADMNSLSAGNDSAILGRINLTISSCIEGTTGRGDLEIDRPPHEGRYFVLLDMEPPKEENWRSRSQAEGPEPGKEDR